MALNEKQVESSPDSTTTDSAQPTGISDSLAARYTAVRDFSHQLVASLSPEDCVIQSMPDVSPTRWHLAHTTWFFETFVLAATPGYEAFHPDFEFLFNSYYNTVGHQFPRPQRGLLSRPGLDEIIGYRRHVDQRMQDVLADLDHLEHEHLRSIVEIGIQHEQQHQELMLTDIKHVLSRNPLFPVYRDFAGGSSPAVAPAAEWLDYDEGLRWIGFDDGQFCYDNETPRHRQFLEAFVLASRPVTCGEFLEFVQDDGYRRAELWLSLGWQTVCDESWEAPLYWHQRDGRWHQFTLSGLHEMVLDEPVCHVSYFEADAFARWSGGRLPTEAEWETAAADVPVGGNFADGILENGAAPHPVTAASGDTLPAKMYGDVWEWTASPYTAYPGYRPPNGALGEYNGKFMCNQFVLRGGSCATSSTHIRRTYRNFFPPEARWQFSGIRLAR